MVFKIHWSGVIVSHIAMLSPDLPALKFWAVLFSFICMWLLTDITSESSCVVWLFDGFDLSYVSLGSCCVGKGANVFRPGSADVANFGSCCSPLPAWIKNFFVVIAVDVKFVFDSLSVLMSSANLSPDNFVADGLFEHNDQYSGRQSRFNFSLRNSLDYTIVCARILKVSPASSLTLLGTVSDFMVSIIFKTGTIAWHRDDWDLCIAKSNAFVSFLS